MHTENDTLNVIRSLELAIAQLDMSLKDSADSVTDTLESVLAIAEKVNLLDEKLGEFTQSMGEDDSHALKSYAKDASAKAGQLLMSMQFFDRLTQRVEHIEYNLRSVADLLKSPGKEHPALWEELQAKLKSVYSTEQEQHLLSQVLKEHSFATSDVGSPAAALDDIEGDTELF